MPVYYTTNETSAANRMVTLELFNPSAGVEQSTNYPRFAYLTILDPQLVNQPPGSIDPAAQAQLGTGFNGIVDSLALQPDGAVLAGGGFTFVDNYPFNYLTRLLSDGHYDNDFLGAVSGGNVLQIVSQNPFGSPQRAYPDCGQLHQCRWSQSRIDRPLECGRIAGRDL